MNALRDEVRRAGTQTIQATTAWRGVVSVGATDMSTKITVVVPALSNGLPISGCRWQSRDSSSKPAPGDLVLVVYDDRGEPWVTAWWPEGFDSE